MVYLAEDTQLERQVALKTPHFEKQPTDELLERFYREARAAATLRHPNICPVYDVGQIEGTHYISMAYIEGNPLSAFIRAQAAAGAADPARRPQAGAGAAGRARPRHRAPRLEAGQHHGRQAERADDHGFRPRPAVAARAECPHHAERHADRHAGLHVARADRRRAGQGRPAVGPVQPGRDPVRTAHGPVAVPRLADRR